MFKRYIKCPLCHGAKQFRTGLGAKVKGEWNCPECEGAGKLTLHLSDRILFAVATKLSRILHKYN